MFSWCNHSGYLSMSLSPPPLFSLSLPHTHRLGVVAADAQSADSDTGGATGIQART